MNKLHVAINRNHKGKVKQTWQWHKFNAGFENELLTLDEFIAAVHEGYAYTAWHEGYRRRENFVKAQILALDFDSEDDDSRLETLARDSFIQKYGLFLHTTASHTEEAPRARAVFALEEPVEDSGEFERMARALIHKYESDESCKDSTRIFFGAPGCTVIKIGNILPLDVIKKLILEHVEHLTKDGDQRMDRTPSQIIGVEDVPDSLLSSVAEKMIQHVLDAPDGAKHDTLNRIAYAFGGFIASGYYNETEVIQWLREAITQRDIKSQRHAFNTIEGGLKDGKQNPSHFYIQGGSYTYDSPPEPVHKPVGRGERDMNHKLQFFMTK
jgi:hypothetical protein